MEVRRLIESFDTSVDFKVNEVEYYPNTEKEVILLNPYYDVLGMPTYCMYHNEVPLNCIAVATKDFQDVPYEFMGKFNKGGGRIPYWMMDE